MGVFNCLHPRTIVNDRGCTIRVRCGRCEACVNMKGLSYSTQCKLESQSHRYTMFVTLTYRDSELPFVTCYPRHGNLFFVPQTKRLIKHTYAAGKGPFYGIAHCCEFNTRSLSMYYDKFKLSYGKGLIPCLDKRDVQDFMKRLRYYLSKYSDEKIRYFACGEYGPVHFRPHYHLLLWYDEPETFAYLGKAILKAWTFGRVDYELSKGKTASYVANYANSLSNRSRLHAIKCFNPFVLHSSHLFGSFYEDEIEEVYSHEYTDFAGKYYTDCGRVKPVAPLLAFENKFYRRCLNYGEISFSDRIVCYTMYERARRAYGFYCVEDLVKCIMSDEDGEVSRLIRQISFTCGYKENTLRSVLYTSKNFLKCAYIYHLSPADLVRKIDKYWQDKDYYNLVQQLCSQCEFLQQVEPDQTCWLLYWYDNFDIEAGSSSTSPSYPKPVVDYIKSLGLEPNFVLKQFMSLEHNPVFSEFAAFHRKLSRDMVKHKELNDLNNIFVYG